MYPDKLQKLSTMFPGTQASTGVAFCTSRLICPLLPTSLNISTSFTATVHLTLTPDCMLIHVVDKPKSLDSVCQLMTLLFFPDGILLLQLNKDMGINAWPPQMLCFEISMRWYYYFIVSLNSSVNVPTVSPGNYLLSHSSVSCL